MKALVVDDSAVMRKILVGALGQAGIAEVAEAGDGQQAVTAVAAGGIELVLMDWNMPNMLGIDAVRAIRAAGHAMPIIMVTTEAEKLRVIEALRAGANNYIVKPFKPETVAAKVQETLAKAGA